MHTATQEQCNLVMATLCYINKTVYVCTVPFFILEECQEHSFIFTLTYFYLCKTLYARKQNIRTPTRSELSTYKRTGTNTK